MVPFYFKKKTGQLKFAVSYKLICKPVTPLLEALSYGRKVDGCTALQCNTFICTALHIFTALHTCTAHLHCTPALHCTEVHTVLHWDEAPVLRYFPPSLLYPSQNATKKKCLVFFIFLFHKYIWLCVVYENSCITICYRMICHHRCLQSIKYHMKPINITVMSHFF